MILKKALTTTSAFILSAVLLSQVYSIAQSRFQARDIDTSAFKNFATNIKEISSATAEKREVVNSDAQITNEIIHVIDKELSHSIKKTRVAVVKSKSLIKKPKIKVVESKAEITKTESVITNSEDLSSYEINNSDLISLYALNVDALEYSTFSQVKLSYSYGEEIKDEVTMKVASTDSQYSAPIEADEVKLIQHAQVKEKLKNNDDLLMFEYSDKVSSGSTTNDIDKKLYDRPISNTVKRAIIREMGSSPLKNLASLSTRLATRPSLKADDKILIEDKEIDLNSEDTVMYDYSEKASSKTIAAKADESAFTDSAAMTTHEAQFVLRAKELNLDSHKSIQLHGFEFVPDYDRAERVSDLSTGEIRLGYSVSGEMNTQTGVIQSSGLIPTRVELSLGEMRGLEIPLLNEAGIQKFLQKQGLSVEGNLLMVALNPNIVDIEIDSSFGAKFFLDRNFKPVQQIGGANFLLFVGVKTGNVLIKYQLAKKESAQKIVYVGDGEMYFEDPSFKSAERETLILTTRNLLGQKKKELSIDGSLISFFNTSTIAKKKAFNAYELKIPTLVTGMRKYLELRHLKDSLFVGLGGEKEVEIPGNEFIAKVLEINQINNLRERCIVQINLSKDLRSLTANGKNRNGEMFVETTFLDKDGNFTKDSSELADKAFISGDMEGQFSVKLDYTDGSTEFLKTFCSEGSYLVEQL